MEEFKVIEVTGCVSEITLSFSRDLDIEKARQPENYVIQPPDISKMEPFAIGKIVRIKGLKLRKGNEYRIKISDKITDTDGNPLPPENREVVFTPKYVKRKVRITVVQPLWIDEWMKYFYYGERKNKPPHQAYADYINGFVDEAGEIKSDIVCLPENPYFDENLKPSPPQTIPGPFYNQMAERAAKYSMYVIGCYKEIVDGRICRFAFIIDRNGNLLGKYHKVHEPSGMERVKKGEIGLGNEMPVFETDFGKIAIMICMDQVSVEMPRIYAAKGADILFLPDSTGGLSTGCEMNAMLRVQAWALDNCIVVVPCRNGRLIDRAPGPFGRSCIIDRTGIVMADAGRYDGIASCIIDLERRRLVYGYGAAGINDAHYRIFIERRPEVLKEITDPKLRGR
ncbi:MAG: hypothetical protein DRP67_04860 [Candidatus Omnitrophota bacterium]|nr:MAG: hypothetical protein DRP67_04860 [Candidatus Omnitrophota bacterium]